MRKEVTVAAFVIVVYSCRSGEDPELQQTCIPGESIVCSCSSDIQGIQKCNSEGMSFDECVCEEGDTTSSSSQIEDETTGMETSEEGSDSGMGGSATSSTGEESTSTWDTSIPETETGMDVGTSTGDSGGGTEGSSVEPQTLVVKADGEKIGYLDFVSYYTIYIWDDIKNIRFAINDGTGYLVGSGFAGEFENATCSGSGYGMNFLVADVAICDKTTEINHPFVTGWGGDTYGFTKPMKALILSGKPTIKEVQSVKNQQGDCIDYTNIEAYRCAIDLKETNLIPTAFPLPITITQE